MVLKQISDNTTNRAIEALQKTVSEQIAKELTTTLRMTSQIWDVYHLSGSLKGDKLRKRRKEGLKTLPIVVVHECYLQFDASYHSLYFFDKWFHQWFQ